MKQDPENPILKEIACFHESVHYILSCYKNCQYPQKHIIWNIYNKYNIAHDIILSIDDANKIIDEKSVTAD